MIPSNAEKHVGANETDDYFYLPTQNDITGYFPDPSDRKCIMSGDIFGSLEDDVFSISHDDYNKYGGYWLRDAYISSDYSQKLQAQFSYISYYDNPIYSYSQYFDNYEGIRPMIRVDLSKI